MLATPGLSATTCGHAHALLTTIARMAVSTLSILSGMNETAKLAAVVSFVMANRRLESTD